MPIHLLHRDGNGQLQVSEFLRNPPLYAILTHTWGQGEVEFRHIRDGTYKNQAGLKKIEFCMSEAQADGLDHCWIDTCCIDKTDIRALQSAINSMFRWYKGATRCYAYLSDVSFKLGSVDQQFGKSRWFTRGWTLQEMLAPADVEFFSSEGQYLWNKLSKVYEIAKITGVPAAALHHDNVVDFGFKDILRWIEGRETKYEEDMVYSLLGLVGLNLAPIFGERADDAYIRLCEEQEAAMKRIPTFIKKHHEGRNGHLDVAKTMERVIKDRMIPNLRKHVKEYVAACTECQAQSNSAHSLSEDLGGSIGWPRTSAVLDMHRRGYGSIGSLPAQTHDLHDYSDHRPRRRRSPYRNSSIPQLAMPGIDRYDCDYAGPHELPGNAPLPLDERNQSVAPPFEVVHRQGERMARVVEQLQQSHEQELQLQPRKKKIKPRKQETPAQRRGKQTHAHQEEEEVASWLEEDDVTQYEAADGSEAETERLVIGEQYETSSPGKQENRSQPKRPEAQLYLPPDRPLSSPIEPGSRLDVSLGTVARRDTEPISSANPLGADPGTSIGRGRFAEDSVCLAAFEEILEHDPSENEYLIKWGGFPSSDSFWEPAENIPAEYIKAFHDSRKPIHRSKLRKLARRQPLHNLRNLARGQPWRG